jgi:hypothetical protein
MTDDGRKKPQIVRTILRKYFMKPAQFESNQQQTKPGKTSLYCSLKIPISTGLALGGLEST